jgi:hypothetical protein
LRFTATKTFTILSTPGGSSSPRSSFEPAADHRLGIVILGLHCLQIALDAIVLNGELPPLVTLDTLKKAVVDRGALLDTLRSGGGDLPDQHLAKARESGAL